LPLIIAARAAVCGALIVGPEAVDPYGRVYAPLVTLGWIAGWTERIGLGTSMVWLALHHPVRLAKEVRFEPDGIRSVAALAEELEFDSVWVTDHIIVGPQAVSRYRSALRSADASFGPRRKSS
jgi:alkanesulfonate monooxygenase SsuD/methylene tetrahydromethanopterin reductase-like flavin-dependent oxidoreductase (luciferase family)